MAKKKTGRRQAGSKRDPLFIDLGSTGLQAPPAYNRVLAAAELGLAAPVKTTAQRAWERHRDETIAMMRRRYRRRDANSFVGWSRKKGYNHRRLTLGGRRYREFVAEQEAGLKAALERISLVFHLYKSFTIFAQSPEGRMQEAEDMGWNMCIMSYIENGKVPEEKVIGKDEDRWSPEAAERDGWNKARERILRIEKG